MRRGSCSRAAPREWTRSRRAMRDRRPRGRSGISPRAPPSCAGCRLAACPSRTVRGWMGGLAPAVAQAAMESGVATRPLADLEAYRQAMARFMYQSGASMEPVFAAAKVAQKQIALAEGEDDRVLRAAQLIVDESLGRPVLVGRPDVINPRIESLGLRLEDGRNCEVVCYENDGR